MASRRAHGRALRKERSLDRRADADTGETPFLTVTAGSRQGYVAPAAGAGVGNTIIKPFAANALGGRIVKLMEKI